MTFTSDHLKRLVVFNILSGELDDVHRVDVSGELGLKPRYASSTHLNQWLSVVPLKDSSSLSHFLHVETDHNGWLSLWFPSSKRMSTLIKPCWGGSFFCLNAPWTLLVLWSTGRRLQSPCLSVGLEMSWTPVTTAGGGDGCLFKLLSPHPDNRHLVLLH